MYIPKQFEAIDHVVTLEVMRAHNFATIVTTQADGAPLASHVPVIVENTDDSVLLRFHFARANPHAALLLESKTHSMFAFMGPHAYMSPSVYPDLRRVPTWNYIAVHAYGLPVEVIGDEKKDALLKSLIALHEPAYAEQWRGLDAAYQATMLGAIVAFEMPVSKLESKFKLNQHRKEAHAAMKASYGSGSPDEKALAHWMERLGL
ncbi:MAG: FMN-binding negative transcriptional regulator [Betaproteobacteria bacterium]|nr:MAG: FMN-binding negative transcriptional regulator [Betaproteobacteria bacterium]